MIARMPTYWSYFSETGWPGKLSVAVSIAGLCYALIIHGRRLGIRHRLALAVYSPLPLLLGLFGISSGLFEVVDSVFSGALYVPEAGFADFLERFKIVPLTLLETLILLFLSFLLIVHDAVKDQATRRDPS